MLSGAIANLNSNNISHNQIDRGFLYDIQRQQKMNTTTQTFEKQPQQWLFDKTMLSKHNE